MICPECKKEYETIEFINENNVVMCYCPECGCLLKSDLEDEAEESK